MGMFSRTPDSLVGQCGSTVITTGVSDIGVAVYGTLSSYTVFSSDTEYGGGIVGKEPNTAAPFRGCPPGGLIKGGEGLMKPVLVED